jgi:hypothetical protein
VASITASIQDWNLRGPGWYEGIYWPFYQLCTTWNYQNCCNLLSWEVTFLQPVVYQVGLQLVLVVHGNGDIFMVRTQLSAILVVFLFILVKIFPIRLKKYLAWIRWFSWCAKVLAKLQELHTSADMFLKIKIVWLLDVIPEMLSF